MNATMCLYAWMKQRSKLHTQYFTSMPKNESASKMHHFRHLVLLKLKTKITHIDETYKMTKQHYDSLLYTNDIVKPYSGTTIFI